MIKQARIFLFGCMLTFGAVVRAQSDSDYQRRPVGLKLTSEATRVCLGSFVPLRLKMKNQTDNEVQISKLDIWRFFTFEHLDADGSKYSIGYGLTPGRIEDEIRLRNEIFLLKPGATQETDFRFPLVDLRYFSTPSKYTLRSCYKEIGMSNIVSFETYACSSK